MKNNQTAPEATLSNTADIPDDVTLTLAEWEDTSEIGEKLATTLIRLQQAWSPESPFVVHVKTTQGTGKTSGSIETLSEEYRGGPAAFFGPRHEDVQDDADRPEFVGMYEIHFEGKDRACIHPEYEGQHAAVSQSLSQQWCDGCEHRGECTYHTPYSQIHNEGMQDYTAVHQHLKLHSKIFASEWDELDAILVDESPWDGMAERSVTLSSEALIAAKLTVRKLADEAPVSYRKALLDRIESALGAIVDAVKSGDEANRKATYQRWAEVCDSHSKSTLSKVVGEITEERLDEISTQADTVVRRLVEATPAVRTNWDQLEEEDMTLPDMDAPPVFLWNTTEGVFNAKWLDIRWLTGIAMGTPTFVLATEMPTELVERLFDLPVVTITDELKPNVRTHQLSTRSAGVTQLKEKKRMWDQLCDLTIRAIQRERQRGNTPFVVVKEDLEEKLKQKLEEAGFSEEDDYEIDHYYGITGSNQYEHCGAVVLFGKPGLRRQDAADKASLTGIDEEVFLSEKGEGELRDALHRIRPVWKDQTRAYILTNMPDFDDEFAPTVERYSVPEMRDWFDTEATREDRRQQILAVLAESESRLLMSEIDDQVSGSYSKLKRRVEELVERHEVDCRARSTGGQPAKEYTVRNPESS